LVLQDFISNFALPLNMTMKLQEINKILPTELHAVSLLETVFWDGIPKCPYCKSLQATSFNDDKRYKCNTCENSYSVTVKTMFHRTKIDLRKWIYLLLLMASGSELPSLRDLGEEMKLTKDTVSKMLHNVRNNYITNKVIIDKLLNKISYEK
jgi:transposase-like protein